MSGPLPRKSKLVKGRLELSPRERSILHLASLGYTDRAISAELGISKGTLGTYWNRLRMKIGSFNRTELVATVLRNDFDKELSQAITKPATEEPYHEAEDSGTHANVLLLDASGVVNGASPTVASLFGVSLHDILGARIETVVPELLTAIQTELLRVQLKGSVLHQSDSQNLVLTGHRPGGITFPLTAILWPIVTDSGWLVLCGLRDLNLEVTEEPAHAASSAS